MNNGSGSEQKPEKSPNPVEKFEQAFQACFMGITKDDILTNLDSDEIKNDADQTVQNLMDSARSMEAYFLKKRLHIASQKPELILKDECYDLRQELSRKDELLKKNYDKLGYWQSILADLQTVSSVGGKTVGNPIGSQTPGSSSGSMGGPLTPGGGGRPQTPASVGRPQTPGGGGPLTPQGRMQPSPSLGFNPMGQGPMSQGPTGLQGPLAYLEKTASTIGMNEQR